MSEEEIANTLFDVASTANFSPEDASQAVELSEFELTAQGTFTNLAVLANFEDGSASSESARDAALEAMIATNIADAFNGNDALDLNASIAETFVFVTEPLTNSSVLGIKDGSSIDVRLPQPSGEPQERDLPVGTVLGENTAKIFADILQLHPAVTGEALDALAIIGDSFDVNSSGISARSEFFDELESRSSELQIESMYSGPGNPITNLERFEFASLHRDTIRNLVD